MKKHQRELFVHKRDRVQKSLQGWCSLDQWWHGNLPHGHDRHERDHWSRGKSCLGTSCHHGSGVMWCSCKDVFFLKPRAGCYSAQAQRTVKGACLWWPFLSAWLPICTLHLWPDLAFQTLQAKHPEKSLLVWPVFKRMACSMRELVEPLLPTSRWRTHRTSFIILLFLGKCVLQLGASRKCGQTSSRKPTI